MNPVATMDDDELRQRAAEQRALERQLAEEDWWQAVRVFAQQGGPDVRALLMLPCTRDLGASAEPVAAERARQRAAALLLENLTAAQLRQYLRDRSFDVIGGQSGKRYRIWHRTQQNIEELDVEGRRRWIWCVHPVGVELADVLLAQKVALELFEHDALSIAQCYSDFAFNSAPADAPWR